MKVNANTNTDTNADTNTNTNTNSNTNTNTNPNTNSNTHEDIHTNTKIFGRKSSGKSSSIALGLIIFCLGLFLEKKTIIKV